MIHVCIVGVGLIGGSLGSALRRVKSGRRRRYRVSGLGRSMAALKKAVSLAAVDDATNDAADVIPHADIVVLCVPVQSIAPITSRIAPLLKRNAVVTDVGSVKRDVVERMRIALRARPDVSFVGGHPIAGSEKTGVEHASADLFRKSVCALIPGGGPGRGFSAVRAMWRAAGARCVTVPAGDHDRYLALTSHLPHLIAFAYFSLVQNAARHRPLIRALAGGSFRDMTRIAGADADLWTGVLRLNRREIGRAKSGFLREMNRVVNSSDLELRRFIESLTSAKRRW